MNKAAIHGMTHSAEFAIWTGAKQRCRDKNSKDYANYGARGITVCDEWQHDFRAFLRDMGPRPSARHSLDRIDNNGPYSKANCRWSTRHQQSNNRRNTRFLTLGNRTQSVSDWCKETGIAHGTLWKRLEAGWPIDRVLTATIRQGKRLTFRGKTLTLAQWAKRLGLSRRAIGQRLTYGWSIKRALTTPPQHP